MNNAYFKILMIWMLSCSCISQVSNESIDLSQIINADNIEEHIKTLASDKYMGRQPGTLGGDLTTTYIKQYFEQIGIKPANGDSYFQKFNISEIRPVLPNTFTVSSGSSAVDLEVKADFIAKTNHYNKTIEIDKKEIVFVGFGIVAEEYDWNDYQDIDVTDKIVMAMYSDPGLYDTAMFNGLNGTPYASITSKQKEAVKRGAAGFFTIFQDTGPTGLNWPMIEAIATRPSYFLAGSEPNLDETIPFSGVLSIEATKKLLEMSGEREDYIQWALSKDFKAKNLEITGSINISSTINTFETANVIGMIEGAEKPNEVVIYTAHWDHVGVQETPINGDSIRNGAIDNASGTAMVLETARIFNSLPKKPERSILFFLTSAEEMGLLGAEYYSENPLFPLHETVCVINTDAAHATEPMRIAVDVLKGYSEMDSLVAEAANEIGREVIPDPTPQIGAFYRSDHFPFVEKGIPAAWVVGGGDPMEGDSAKAMQIIYDYGPNKYHQVTDEYYDGFIMGNIRLDATTNLLIGYKAANGNMWPNWKQDSPYRPLRDSLLNLRQAN